MLPHCGVAALDGSLAQGGVKGGGSHFNPLPGHQGLMEHLLHASFLEEDIGTRRFERFPNTGNDRYSGKNG